MPKIRVFESFSGLSVTRLVTVSVLFSNFITGTGEKKASEGFSAEAGLFGQRTSANRRENRMGGELWPVPRVERCARGEGAGDSRGGNPGTG